MSKSDAIKLSPFVLIFVGTIGLLVNEFVADWGSGATITFACFNASGLAALVIYNWTKRKR